MTIKHIKIFIAVCDTGSMTAASKQLFIAQPAVSFAIAEMENYYGQKLFERISNRLYITEAGKQFLQYSKQISALFDEMENEIKNWDSIGSLRVGSNITIGTNLLPDLVNRFKVLYPNSGIQAVVDHTGTLEKLLLDNKLDLALIEGSPSSHLLISKKFAYNQISFICSPLHPWANRQIELADLNHCSFLMREKESSERQFLDEFFRREKIQIQVSWQSSSQQSILNAVSQNLGVAALSGYACNSAIQAKNVAPFFVKNVKLERELHIVYHQNKFLTNLMQDFLDLCTSEASF